MTNPARAEANRRNAQKSTGPRTEAGKARSRLNGLTHGLRSAEVVLPTESRDEFVAHLGRWLADWNPPTEARRLLVERAAVAAWKLRRCTRVETERMARRSNEAVRGWDQARAEAVDRAVTQMPERARNARSLAVLRSSRDGVDRLLGLWDGLVEALGVPGEWVESDDHHNGLLTLLGLFDPDDPLVEVADRSWELLLINRPDLAEPDDEPTPPGRAEAVRSILLDLCRGQVAALESLWSDLPDPGASRVSVGEDAAFTFDAQDLNLQRHEARLDREARALIAQLTRLEQTGADLLALDRSEDAPTEANPDASGPVGSSSASEATPGLECPELRSGRLEPTPIAPTEANGATPTTATLSIDPDRDGPSWPPSAWTGMTENLTST